MKLHLWKFGTLDFYFHDLLWNGGIAKLNTWVNKESTVFINDKIRIYRILDLKSHDYLLLFQGLSFAGDKMIHLSALCVEPSGSAVTLKSKGKSKTLAFLIYMIN